jgi:hypothetical protein
MIEVTYHHSIEANNVNRVTMGMISIDADADIMTGFQNAAGIYPTFGVDAFVTYNIYPSFVGGKTEASLALKDPEHPAETANISLGSYSSDTSYRRIGDQKIELSLPVALIPPINSNSFIVADTMAPETDLVDSLPNNGGIRLGDGSIKLFNQPETPDKSLTDAEGDSFAFGGDNDDLIGIKGSFCQAGALIEISYSDFKLGGRAMTTVHLDLDHNSSTGEETINFSQNTKLGIEKSLVYKITDLSGGTQHARQVPNTAQVAPIGGTAGSVGFFTGILVEGSTGDLIDGYNQLFTIDYIRNKVYITVPYELLQNQNVLGIHAWTISGTFGIGTIVDEIPDEGSLIIKKTSYATPKDLNQDGKIDIWDLIILGNNFGKTGSNLKADINQNGIVDIFDLVLIGKYFS